MNILNRSVAFLAVSLFLLALLLSEPRSPRARVNQQGPALASTAAQSAELSGFTESASGVRSLITRRGAGPTAREGQFILFHYVGRLDDGKVFDDSALSHEPAVIVRGQPSSLPKGLHEIVEGLRAGDQARIIVPPSLGYGSKGNASLAVPANTTLHYDVEVQSIKSQKLSRVILKEVQHAGLHAGRRLFDELKAKGFPDIYEGASQLNYLGSGFLYRYHAFPEAIAFLQWNQELYPQSGDVVAALAEAYYVSGDREQAIGHYRRALAIQPDSKTAADMLATLERNPESPTLEQRLDMCLAEADLYLGPLAEERINIPSLRNLLEDYLNRAPASRAVDTAKRVEQFFEIVEADNRQAQDALFRKFVESPLTEVRHTASRLRATDRRARQARDALLQRIRQPVEMRFTALDRRNVDAASLRGKVVLIAFWTTSGAASQAASRDVLDVYKNYHAKGFEVISILIDQEHGSGVNAAKTPKAQSAVEVIEFTRWNTMPWPQHYDGEGLDGALAKENGVTSAPTLLLLDKGGLVVSATSSAETLERDVRALLEAGRSSESRAEAPQ